MAVVSDVMWENFANAIVIQAANDWRKATEKLTTNPENEKARKDIEEVEEFFLSDWYGELTSIPGTKLLKMLKEDMANDR